MSVESLVQKVRQINQTVSKNKALLKEMKEVSNTQAVPAQYSGGKVYVDGQAYPCAAASRDVLVQDGSFVWCIPTPGGYAVIGGGEP